MKCLPHGFAATAMLVLSHTGAKAEEASWGCQVLLCAASKDPSWHGVPYCVPPMRKLIAAMAKPHFSWPICQEANAGKPGREDYEDCPAGFQVGTSSSASEHGGGGEPNLCVRTVNQCANRSEFQRLYGSAAANQVANVQLRYLNGGTGDHWNSGSGCMIEVLAPRPRRSEPYYFDIPNNQGVKERFWFDLEK